MRAPRRVRRSAAGAALAVALLVLAGGCGVPTPTLHSSSAGAPSAGRTPDLTVLGLGDSVTAGSNCDCEPFLDRYSDGLRQRGLAVHANNRGEPGATSADLLSDLQSGQTATDVAAADVVVVTIGANDLGNVTDDLVQGQCGPDLACAQQDLARLRSDLPALLQRIRDLRGQRPTAVLVTGYWNVNEDGDAAVQDYTAAGRAASDQVTHLVNSEIAAAAQANGASYVDLAAAFRRASGGGDPTALLADDGDHPNARGHQVIADALLAAGLAPLRLPH